METIDLSKTVYELCTKHEGLAEVLKQLGFTEITRLGMLQTAGRFMTLPKGAAMKKLDLDIIKLGLYEHGYKAIEKEEAKT